MRSCSKRIQAAQKGRRHTKQISKWSAKQTTGSVEKGHMLRCNHKKFSSEVHLSTPADNFLLERLASATFSTAPTFFEQFVRRATTAILFLLLLQHNALAFELNWVVLDKQPHLTLEDWAAFTQYHSLFDARSGRILLERKGKKTIILLLDSPYAFQGENFLPLPQAPFVRGDKILIPAETGERVFSAVLEKEEQKKMEQELQRIKGNLAAGPCQLEHPIKKIFIDPGHGGYDHGTKHGGVNEKDVVLKFSRLVADELRRLGFEVSVSRSKDVFLPLEIRNRLAQEWHADLFISLHVNSSPLSDAHGTETYILSQDATDAEARKLALLENSIVKNASDKQSAVQDILWDMEQTTYLQDSAYLASNIQESLVAHAHELLRKKKISGDWKNRGVRQAPFYVLNKATMPAILVELGYLSNARDRKLMTEKIFQESLAKALAMGVKKYKEACRTSK